MNYWRAIQSGFLVWLMVVTAFSVLELAPGIKESFLLQSIIVMILMIGFSTLGISRYYRRGNIGHGLVVGVTISATALVLDVFVTVPFFEIPAGRTYLSFFTSPVLWILVLINVGACYLYWSKKIKII